MPVRQILWMAEKPGALGLMPAHLGGLAALGLKAVTFFPRNEGTDLDSHQGAVLLFETGRGRLLAIIDASSITAIRTAAVSGVATRLLARADAADLALLGSGVQARTHLEAMLVVRTLRRVRVASKTSSARRASPTAESKRHGISDRRRATRSRRPSPAPTSSARSRPRASRSSGAPGSRRARTSTPSGRASRTARELDTEAVARARLFVDHRESALERGRRLPARARRGRHRRRPHRGRARRAPRPARCRAASLPPRSRCSSRWASRSRTSPRRTTSTRRRAGAGIGTCVELGGGRHDAD